MISGWVHPLSVDPDDRPAVTKANLEAVAAYWAKQGATAEKALRARSENYQKEES